MVLVAAAASPAGAEPRRRLEAAALGVAYHEHSVFDVDTYGTSPTLTLEAGAFVAPEIGFAVLVRGQRYVERIRDLDDSLRRIDVFAGVRVYFQPTPERLLAAVGAGLLVARKSASGIDDEGYEAQKFVEAYVGWAVLRSRCTDLELGAHAGYSPDEEYVWAGLALGVRRRAW